MTFENLIDQYAGGLISLESLNIAVNKLHAESKKTKGAIYTPQSIVDEVISNLPMGPNSTIFEPAAGHGAFLLPALEISTRGMKGREALAWCQKNVLASDIVEKTVTELKSVVQAWFKRKFGLFVETEEITFVKTMDGLENKNHFDIIFGNPPYIRFQTLDPEYRAWLKDNFISCKSGNVDIYYAFVEMAAKYADNVGFIIPNSILHNNSALELRSIISKRVDDVKDFGHIKVFNNASTYTCLLYLSPNGDRKVYHVPSGKTSEFSVEKKKLPEKRKILGGVATLCDRAYKVEKKENGFVCSHTGIAIEDIFVYPLIKATKVWSETPLNWKTFILAPYIEGRLASEDEIRELAPNTWKHLLAVKDLLMARDKGKTENYPAWYAYGREQGLRQADGDEVLVIPTMIGGKSVPKIIDLKRFSKPPLIVSGFGIDSPTREEKTNFLSENFINYIRINGQEKPGKDACFYTVASWVVKGYSGENQESH